MAVAVVPEAAAGEASVGYFEIGLGALFTLVVLIGIRAAWEHTFGGLINWMANVLHVKVWRININVGGPLLKAEAALEREMGRAILLNEKALGLWWNGLKGAVDYTADTLEWFASSTVHAFGNVVHGTIPKVASTIVQPVQHDVTVIRRTSAAAVRDLERTLTRQAHAIEHELAHDFGRAWRGIDYLTGTAIPNLWKDVRGLNADVGQLEHQVGRIIPRRLTRLEKLLGAGVIGGIAIGALTRVFPYWQCSNVRRFMRGVCRSPFGAFDWLFALVALEVVALDPIVVLHAAEDATDELEAIIRQMAGLAE